MRERLFATELIEKCCRDNAHDTFYTRFVWIFAILSVVLIKINLTNDVAFVLFLWNDKFEISFFYL